MATTTGTEDYLERIYTLIQDKGYARVVDIASSLQVQPSAVAKMIQKLEEQKLVRREKYRGLVLTPAGETLAKAVRCRHLKLMVTVRAFATLRRLLGTKEVQLALTSPARVRDALHALLASYPGLDARLLDGQGELLPHVSVFLNGRDVRHLAGLVTPLKVNDVLALFPPVAGG